MKRNLFNLKTKQASSLIGIEKRAAVAIQNHFRLSNYQMLLLSWIKGLWTGVLLSLVLVFAAWRLLWSSNEEKEVVRPGSYLAVASGGGIGFASGMIGIGGGIFLSPLLILRGWADAKEAAAVAALFIWLNSLSGLVGSALSGGFGLDLELFAPFAGAVLIGGLIGSKYGSEISGQAGIRRLLVVVLLIAASKRVMGIFGV